ncbi:MAG: hypothetical protein D8M59_13695 [Planctomycetes bacterium]|nr:hypothetical protein [Planctomycetota bacterium]NOG53735.1 hypothetical protein [Planctomycetota bacterium]
MPPATKHAVAAPQVGPTASLRVDWSAPRFTIDINPETVDQAAQTEWVLTNGLGGFAMGTALGLNTRRYHGLLVAATHPPLGRIMALNAVSERIDIHDASGAAILSDQLAMFAFHAGEATSYPNATPLIRFEKGLDFVCWTYRTGEFTITRRLRLGWQMPEAQVAYEIAGPKEYAVQLTVSPLTRLADYHKLTACDRTDDTPFDQYTVESQDRGRLVVAGPGATVALSLRPGRSVIEPDWWYAFHYEKELQRGQDHVEDLFAPGHFTVAFKPGRTTRKATLKAECIVDPVSSVTQKPGPRQAHITAIQSRLAETKPDLAARADLLVAADDFVVPRFLSDGSQSRTILAGYPWFTDWGRDTLISLPGLLLATRRFDDALAALRSCADALSHGLVPNRFDDSGQGAHYNTVDASLWFLHAACQYHQATCDDASFSRHLAEPCLEIVNAYHHGTDFDIKADPDDGLIMAGNPTTQLTWMDAMRDGVVFTPRYGKAVEINALWYHGLRSLEHALTSVGTQHADQTALLKHMADRVQSSFEPAFKAESHEGISDCLFPDEKKQWSADESIRPNQLFAVSLEYSPLSPARQAGVVAVCRRELLTPVGLRTLSPKHPKYQGRFEGPLCDRDAAYHQGTVWPWLMGPYVEALLRTADFSAQALRLASSLLDRLEQEMSGPDARSLGQLHEVYDGDDDPANERHRRPDGCIAQAWSVAELIRCRALIESHQPG